MFKIVLLKRETFSLRLVLEKAFFQLQLFLHGNHRWDQFLFFFDGEDSARSQQNYVQIDAKNEKQGAQIAKKKKIKMYILHQQAKFKKLSWVVLRGVFRIQ